MATKVVVGYWRQSQNEQSDLPFPVATEVNTIMDLEFVRVLKYVEKNKARSLHCKGWSNCRLCQEPNGSVEYQLTINNVTYVWPDGYKHYIEEHGVMPDYDFMSAVLKAYGKEC